jgi:inosine-uridine nucleoside N-ribohydrolase
MLKRFIVMGGASRGNITIGAEFNAFADCEALSICMKSCSKEGSVSVTLLTWETTLAYGLEFEFVDECFSSENTKSNFLGLISQLSLNKTRTPGDTPFHKYGYLIPDPLAMAVALEENRAIASIEPHHAVVELSGLHTRGMLIFDHDDLFHASKNRNVNRVTGLDRSVVKELLIAIKL